MESKYFPNFKFKNSESMPDRMLDEFDDMAAFAPDLINQVCKVENRNCMSSMFSSSEF